MKRLILFTILLPILAAPLVRAEKFYSYTNRNGNLVFSNYRPAEGEAETVKEIDIERERPDLIQFDESKCNLYDEIIMKSSQESGVDFNLIKAVIMVESHFNPRAVSPKGAQGLMQLMPATARRFGVNNPFDPEENIQGGVTYLRYLIDLFEGNLELVLSAYNAGENLVKKIQRIPRIKETINYVKAIINIVGSSKTRISEDFVVYTPGSIFFRYYSEDGVLTLTNIDPPASAKPVK